MLVLTVQHVLNLLMSTVNNRNSHFWNLKLTNRYTPGAIIMSINNPIKIKYGLISTQNVAQECTFI